MPLFDESECSVTDDLNVTGDVTVTNVQFDLHYFVADCDVSFHFVDLNVKVNDSTVVKVNSLFDSGAQLSVLRKELTKTLQYEVIGEVKLRGFDGSVSVGELTVLHTSLANREATVPMEFVVCENVNYDCLLSLAGYRRLLNAPEKRSNASQTPVTARNNTGMSLSIDHVHKSCSVAGKDTSHTCRPTEETDDNVQVVQDQSGVFPLDSPLLIVKARPSCELIDEQQADVNLHATFHLAKQNVDGYFMRSKLAFHCIRILGNTLEHLVVALGRCAALLQLAYEQVGGQLGSPHRRELVRLSLTTCATIIVQRVIRKGVG